MKQNNDIHDIVKFICCLMIWAKGHELVFLRDAIDWCRFEEVLSPAYSSDNGRPSIPVRMMAGLTFLKYMFAMSDQDVLDNKCENPYWQRFCGSEFFEYEPPTDQATMSWWRSRAGYVTVSRTNWVLGAMALPRNPYDGNTLQIVNWFRTRKPRCVLRWWKRSSVIESITGHIKSDHYMEHNARRRWLALRRFCASRQND